MRAKGAWVKVDGTATVLLHRQRGIWQGMAMRVALKTCAIVCRHRAGPISAHGSARGVAAGFSEVADVGHARVSREARSRSGVGCVRRTGTAARLLGQRLEPAVCTCIPFVTHATAAPWAGRVCTRRSDSKARKDTYQGKARTHQDAHACYGGERRGGMRTCPPRTRGRWWQRPR